MHSFACLQPIKAMTKLLEFLGMRTHMVQLWLNQPYPTMSSVRVAVTYLQALCTFILTLASSQASAMFLELMSQPAGSSAHHKVNMLMDELHSSNFSGIRTIYSEPSSPRLLSCHAIHDKGVVGKGGLGGLKSLQILSLCYYVYKQLPQRDIQNLEKRKEKTAFRL